MRFRAADPAALLIVLLDEFVAAFHRPSGITHLLIEPAPRSWPRSPTCRRCRRWPIGSPRPTTLPATRTRSPREWTSWSRRDWSSGREIRDPDADRPASFRVGSAWAQPIALLADLYRDYPAPGVPDFTVRLEPTRPWRRWLRPSVGIAGDFTLPEAAPLPLAQALLAAEMGMNLQMALGWRRHLLLHASTVERGGRALLMTGESGAGKSTLAGLLAPHGWRFMGDEFALIDPATRLAHAFPRLISLKNASIDAVSGER